jgi:hypothetical protein
MLSENYKEAIALFHAAIALNSMNTDAAQRGLDRLEKTVRGIDPNDDQIDEIVVKDSPSQESVGTRGSYGGGRPSY